MHPFNDNDQRQVALTATQYSIQVYIRYIYTTLSQQPAQTLDIKQWNYRIEGPIYTALKRHGRKRKQQGLGLQYKRHSCALLKASAKTPANLILTTVALPSYKQRNLEPR